MVEISRSDKRTVRPAMGLAEVNTSRETATTAVVRPNLTHTGVKSELRSRGVVYDARDLSAACRHSDGHHVIFQKRCIAD